MDSPNPFSVDHAVGCTRLGNQCEIIAVTQVVFLTNSNQSSGCRFKQQVRVVHALETSAAEATNSFSALTACRGGLCIAPNHVTYYRPASASALLCRIYRLGAGRRLSRRLLISFHLESRVLKDSTISPVSHIFRYLYPYVRTRGT
jgi:hypothetical protein